ncbi:hypothetical protein HMPREF9418_2843 [Neisseria macacae ATCC 33926]|uniref:Uncharacterized protein n=1 Tax=Neisseria macacae ATCC 33926 TaxID=997348 RepID=A0AA36XK53_9NEIS|nr:hypothetical protein HMPREF9418_2843 [Neisseria macacae ATCC 33926]
MTLFSIRNLPIAVIPTPAYARTGYGRNPFLKFRNCFSNQGFSSFTMDSRLRGNDGI